MPDPLLSDARAFFADLSRNNDRAWFQAHKARYEERLKAPALGLLDRLGDPLSRLAGAPVETKLFRPNRDVRFSKDKTPYTLHLHMLWSVHNPGGPAPAFFFGISPDYVTAGAGIMDFRKDTLARFREGVDADPEGWTALMARLATLGLTASAPDLKRVPAPYDADHPAADLLRHKSLTASREIPGEDIERECLATFTDLAPLVRRLMAP